MNSRSIPFSTALLLITAATSVFSEEVSFNRDIRPIISDRCFKCHGPDAKNQDSEFRLDTFEHATEDLPPCPTKLQPATTDEALLRRTLELMRRYNVTGVVSGPLETVAEWHRAAPERFIPGVLTTLSEPRCATSTRPS